MIYILQFGQFSNQLVKSYPHRLEAVIAAKGASIIYEVFASENFSF